MKNLISKYPILAVVALVSGLISSACSIPEEKQDVTLQEQAVLEVAREFKEALRTGDVEGVVGLLHPDGRIYEGGHAETLDDYKRGHLKTDMEFLQAVETSTLSEQVVIGRDLSVYLSEYASVGEFRGREIDSHGTETLVLASSAAGWKVRHIHWSNR